MDELNWSEAVFAGQIVALADQSALVNDNDVIKATFQVSRVWKGPAQKSLVVESAPSGDSCGYQFELGKKYIVYARGAPDKLSTGLCQRTRPVEVAVEDFAQLGPGTAVESDDIASLLPTNLIPILSGAGLALVLLVVVRAALGFRVSRSAD